MSPFFELLSVIILPTYHIPAAINKRIGQALHDYEMLAEGDRILLAVSGGVDSLVLCHILKLWHRKAPISFKLMAVHLDLGFAKDGPEQVASQLANTGLDYQLIHTNLGPTALEQGKGKDICFHCARNRRSRLFELCRELDCNKLALGHHKDDIIETFFINLMYGGNISTMLPSQTLFKGNLQLIRPLAYLDKKAIETLGLVFKTEAVPNLCPQSEVSKRVTIRQHLAEIYQQSPEIRNTIFASLANSKAEYLPKITRN